MTNVVVFIRYGTRNHDHDLLDMVHAITTTRAANLPPRSPEPVSEGSPSTLRNYPPKINYEGVRGSCGCHHKWVILPSPYKCVRVMAGCAAASISLPGRQGVLTKRDVETVFTAVSGKKSIIPEVHMTKVQNRLQSPSS